MSSTLQIIYNGQSIGVLKSGTGKDYSIGGTKTSDIYIATRKDMSIDLKVFYSSEHWWLRDCGSQPTFTISGKRFNLTPLLKETNLQAGDEVFQLIISGEDEEQKTEIDILKDRIYDDVVSHMKSEAASSRNISDSDLRKRVEMLTSQLVKSGVSTQEASLEQSLIETMKDEIVQDILHLGTLEPLIADDSITEIMVIDYKTIYIEKNGKLCLSRRTFRNPEHLQTVIERIVTPIGRRIDESSPLVDARLTDGSRVNAVIPPITPDGACLTIRKFGKAVFTVEKLVSYGSMISDMGKFIDACIKIRKNIVVSGGTGSGKTSLLNALSNFLPEDERIITIEDSLELKLQQKHVVRMEARPPNAEGKGEVSIRSLVKNSLRMRPDRIVIGECRGGEALDMLQAMNTGHDGSLTTVHANSPKDTISRLETLVLMAGMDLPLSAVRNQICSAINLIVQTSRLSDGSRKVISISEITGIRNGEPEINEIYTFKQEGIDKKTGKVIGHHVLVNPPTFLEEFKSKGIDLPSEMFAPPRKEKST